MWLLGAAAALSSGLMAQGPSVRGIDKAFHSQISDVVAGVVLLRELGCAHCHADVEGRFRPRPAPALEQLGAVLRPSYLRTFLGDPPGTAHGTVMPDTLGHLAEPSRQDAIRKLVHFLHSEAESVVEFPALNGEAIEKGKELYHSIGCVACHSAQEDAGAIFPDLVSKYSREGLHRFLLDPLTFRPSGRMPDMHLDYDEALQLTAFLMPESEGLETFVPDRGLQDEGRRIARQLLCLECHEHETTTTTTERRSLDQLSLDRGCLSGKQGSWPDYPLSDDQRRMIREALSSKQQLSATTEIEVVLRQFNCVACHTRDGYGGPTDAQDRYFETTDLNLGDQGRLPPSLDGVGGKLNATWLRKLLFQTGAARPYMKTRMPRFASAELEPLLSHLAEMDGIEPVAPVRFKEPRKASGFGRTLAGTDGLACVTCHSFKGKKVGAMAAIDLTLMAQRLNRDWFHRYLRSPSEFSPSTLMPAFWGGEESPLPEILEGDVAQQIEALWIYTSEGYSLGTPKGVRREPMQWLATEHEAVMLRRSYPGVGKRGIGVGYPGNVNLVFNADPVGLAMVWQGGFIDPSGVFLSQGHGTARPLSRRPFRFPKGPEIATLPSLESAWPDGGDRANTVSFKGYTLDSRRQPVFRYFVQGWEIEDGFVPYSSKGLSGLRRTISLEGKDDDGFLVMRLAGEKAWLRETQKSYRLPDGLKVEIPDHVEARLLDTEEGNEIRLRLRVDGNLPAQKLVLDYLFDKP